MQFQKFMVSEPFQKYIAYFWTLKSIPGIDENVSYRFVPDAYVDWVFHLGTPWSLRFPDAPSRLIQNKYHVFGQIEKYIDLTITQEPLDIFGVKFYPWCASNIWNVDMHQLTNSCMDLIDLDLPNMSFLQEQISMASRTTDRIHLIEQFIKPYLQYAEMDTLKPIVQQMNINAQTYPKQTIGTRRLQQRFRNEIGISSKLFMKTLRINNVIQDMTNGSETSLTQLALMHNYFDQSHLIKDFKRFTGHSPSAFLKSITPNGDILNLRI